jgi:hypothetical protein
MQMRIVNLALIAACAIFASAGRAGATHVHELDTGVGFQNGPLYITLTGVNGGQPFQTSGGSIGLSPNLGAVDGASVPYLYCVEVLTEINVPGTYFSDLSNSGIVHGGLIANAGKIAWLMDNKAPAATTQNLQEGLQAAIWKQVFGSSFSVAAGTSAGILAAYNADITALGSNVAPVSDVLWISPYTSANSNTPVQGLVTSEPHGIPEPSTIVLAALGGLALLACRCGSFRRPRPPAV